MVVCCCVSVAAVAVNVCWLLCGVVGAVVVVAVVLVGFVDVARCVLSVGC